MKYKQIQATVCKKTQSAEIKVLFVACGRLDWEYSQANISKRITPKYSVIKFVFAFSNAGKSFTPNLFAEQILNKAREIC